jgi:DNA-binding NarL/FixJ family response regulator
VGARWREPAWAREAVAVADRALPDVVVMDVKLQDGSGVEATREIRTKLEVARRAGAAAYLARHGTPPRA